MNDSKGQAVKVGDFVSFAHHGQSKPGQVGEIVEIKEGTPTSNVRVVYAAATPLLEGSFIAGVVHVFGEVLHVKSVHTQWLNGPSDFTLVFAAPAEESPAAPA